VAATTGLVLQLTWADGLPGACVFVGPSLESAEILFIRLRSSDPERVRDFKKSMIALLAKALGAGYPVIVEHPDGGTEVTSATIEGFDISPVGAAIHGDFYSVTGRNIPSDAELVFESAGATVTVTPDLIRPHWVFVARLPVEVPLGRNTVSLQAPGWSSQAVPVDVSGGPQTTVRVLHSGAPKVRPYTIVLVANPAIEDEEGGTFTADAALGDRPGFHDAVSFCLRNMFSTTEDLLRQGHIDASLRLVTVFDETAEAIDANALAHEIDPNLMETRRTRLKGFVGRYGETADVVFVLHGSVTHDRATAWFTTDDAAGPTTDFTFDGAARVHGHLPAIPGSAAIPVSADQTGLTAFHEFGHAASDFNNGKVVDLYADQAGSGGALVVNKKFRADAADPLPADFAEYNGTDHASDQTRDGLGYEAGWTSFHDELIDATRPNMMDNYWQTFDDPQRCRLDQLTYDWFVDRLWAKALR